MGLTDQKNDSMNLNIDQQVIHNLKNREEKYDEKKETDPEGHVGQQ